MEFSFVMTDVIDDVTSVPDFDLAIATNVDKMAD
jgi:hypothetical protein